MKNLQITLTAAAMLLVLGMGILPASAAKPQTQTSLARHTVSVSSNPAGAQVYYNGQLVLAQTPGIITIPVQSIITPDKRNMEGAYEDARRNNSITFTFVHEGYINRNVTLTPNISCRFNQYSFDWPEEAHADLTPITGGAYDKN